MAIKTTEQFIEDANLKHGNKYDYSKTIYVHSKQKVIITCPIHGDFELTPNKHLMGRGCPKCGKISGIEKHKDSLELFIFKAKSRYGNKYDYSKVNYINSLTKVCIVCPEHGEFWQIPANHLRGEGGCPKCLSISRSLKLSSTTEEFIEKARKIHGDKYDYSKVDYINKLEKVCIICPKHGIFWQTPNDHLRGRGCPHCKLKSQYELFNKIKLLFPNEEILFEVNNKIIPWIDKQRFDIYFPKYNIAVEYNGKLHYVPIKYFGGDIKFNYTLQLDESKRKKCLENNCILFEMKYDYSKKDFDKLIDNINNVINKYKL